MYEYESNPIFRKAVHVEIVISYNLGIDNKSSFIGDIHIPSSKISIGQNGYYSFVKAVPARACFER